MVATTNAHGDEISIGILEFQRSPEIPASAASAVEQFIASKLASERRFSVLDRANLGAVQAERSIQLGLEESTRTKLADLGATYVILGEVTQVEVRRIASGGASGFKASITYGLRILDVSTGKVTYSEQFSSSRDMLRTVFAGLTGDVSTASGALDVALRITGSKVDRFIDAAFPVRGSVVSIERRGRRQEAVEVLVSLGPADGVTKGAKLIAFQAQEIEVGGKILERKRKIARLAFVRTEGDNLSIFKVRDGASQMAEAIDSAIQIHVEVAQ